MRTIHFWAGAVVSLLGALPAGAQDSPQALIERAIQAHGGRERLAKVRADRVKLKGKLVVGAAEVPFVGETVVQPPGQYKSVVLLNAEGKPHTVVHVVDGPKAGVFLDGVAQTPDPAVTAQLRHTLNLERALRLVPLLTDWAFALAPAPAIKINGRPADGVAVTVNRRQEMKLYFDRETGLLVKTEHSLPAPGGKVVKHEGYYGAYRDLGGYLRPTRVVAYRDGKKVMEAQLLEARAVERVDPAEFDGP
jgi:hypothetical protein